MLTGAGEGLLCHTSNHRLSPSSDICWHFSELSPEGQNGPSRMRFCRKSPRTLLLRQLRRSEHPEHQGFSDCRDILTFTFVSYSLLFSKKKKLLKYDRPFIVARVCQRMALLNCQKRWSLKKNVSERTVLIWVKGLPKNVFGR